MFKHRLIAGCILFGLMLSWINCNDTEMQSRWNTGEISIDGSDLDWSNSMMILEKEKLGIGLSNDSANLYLCLKSLDRRTQMEIVRLGLTIWFDSTGGGNKSFGIHYPLGLRAGAMTYSREEPGAAEGGTGMMENFRKMLSEMEIVGPDGNVIERFSSLHSYGIRMSLNDSTGALVYELSVPMVKDKDHPYALNLQPGSTVGVGLETGKAEGRLSGQARPGGEDGAPQVGRRGGGRGRGGGGGGSRAPGNGSANFPEPMHFWAKVHLANAPYHTNN